MRERRWVLLAHRNATEGRAEDGNAKERNGKERTPTMKYFQVQLKGVSPYLMCRFSDAAEKPKTTRKMLVNKLSPREEAGKLVYQNSTGQFYFPGVCVERMLRAVAGNHKLTGSRKSAKYVLPLAVRVVEDAIILNNGNGKTPANGWEIDSRPVTIPSTKGRVIRHRPRFDNWSVNFTLRIDEELLDETFIHELMDEAGKQNGLGDFRIEKGGRFGEFQVVEWRQA